MKCKYYYSTRFTKSEKSKSKLETHPRIPAPDSHPNVRHLEPSSLKIESISSRQAGNLGQLLACFTRSAGVPPASFSSNIDLIPLCKPIKMHQPHKEAAKSTRPNKLGLPARFSIMEMPTCAAQGVIRT